MSSETMKKIMKEAKTIAVVGMSRKPHRAGFYVPRYLHEAGYRIYPVNPHLHGPVLGEEPYDSISDLPETVDLVLLFQRSENVPPFVTEAIQAGAKAVWMQLGIRNNEAAAEARQAGLDVVQDACMMVEHRRLMP
jgi:predicted CoA-binding protein